VVALQRWLTFPSCLYSIHGPDLCPFFVRPPTQNCHSERGYLYTIYICTHTPTNTHTHTHMHTHTHTHTLSHTHTHTHTHTRTQSHTCTHTHTITATHKQTGNDVSCKHKLVDAFRVY